jgi:hypothetical protein
MKQYGILLSAVALLLASGAAKADFIISSNFSQDGTGNLGVTNATFVSPGPGPGAANGAGANFSIVVTAVGGVNGVGDLYYKNGGTGETGLGLSNDPQHDNEINIAKYGGVIVDFSKFNNSGYSITSSGITFDIGSVQQGEGYALYAGTSASGKLITSFIATSTDPGTVTYTVTGAQASSLGFNLNGQYFLTAMGTGNVGEPNILLDTVQVNVKQNSTSPVPAPPGVILAGLGMVFFGGRSFLGRKRVADAV